MDGRRPGWSGRTSSTRPSTGATLVVLALALTPETTGILDRRRLELLAPDAWVVNVARGAHIVTDDLVAVLAEGRIGGAALDVTDPEPLPDDHPLWAEPRCIITPHTAQHHRDGDPAAQRAGAGERPAAHRRGAPARARRPCRRATDHDSRARLAVVASTDMDFRTTTVAALAADVSAKRISARELVGAALDRIEEVDPRVNAFVALDGEQALAEAAVARRAGRGRRGRRPARRASRSG